MMYVILLKYLQYGQMSNVKNLGIVPIVISGSHLNTKYYIEHNHSDAIAEDGNSVIRTIGVKAADHKH